MNLRQAMFYEKDGENTNCFLCPHHCNIKPGQKGLCGVRKNDGGVLFTLNYSEIAAFNLDPIEKKPLYHFYPGSWIVSVGSYGCNLKCTFCQNYSIAHGVPQTTSILPDKLVEKALAPKNNIGLAYTYNEPSIWFEYVYDTAKTAKGKGLKNVLVTNGYIEDEPMEYILPYIDAMNIDVKSFRDEYYKDICKGRLAPVLKTVEKAYKNKCHVEVTTLVVGGLNDSLGELEELGRWLGELGRSIPLHLSRYYPAYKMDRPPTEVEVLVRAREIMQRYLDYVYIGNVAGIDNNTYCPRCGEKIIGRNGYRVEVFTDNTRCRNCGREMELTAQ